jgi:crotonobetainyl-CoA:carnitine CoA-transferase CaiB-like acyl-CoA transferase
MQGVRVLEVAEHTFVPAASALLAEWGAEVIKIDHVERGDAMPGLASTGVVADMGSDVHPLLEHSHRGKLSLGLDLGQPDGLASLQQLIAASDVFLTNELPRVLKLQDVTTAAGTPFPLVAAPVQFDEQPPTTRRAPEFDEHGDQILGERGLDGGTIIDL